MSRKLGIAGVLAIGAILVPALLAAAGEPGGRRPPRDDRGRRPQRYSIEQAVSDQAQLHTIAFSGLAFITGGFGESTFLPPGKVCDFFGFQYMRDIDAAGKGHNPMFLDRVVGNVMRTLTPEQRAEFEKLAREQAPLFRKLAEMRFPVIQSFWRQLQAEVPAGSKGLNREAVVRAIGEIFAFDAELAFRRAEVTGGIVASFTPEQKQALGAMKFGDFNTWPDVDAREFKLPRGTEKMVNVAYMTYGSELFSWWAGSVEADVYFCPERHGTYFGGFYMKDMPAMGKRDFDISTSVTGDSGKGFLDALTPEQRGEVTSIIERQRKAMQEIIEVRRAISVELRRFLKGEKADKDKVLKLGRRYGELDGEVSWMYATAFAKVNATLTKEQRELFMKLRNLEGYTPAPAYVYSDGLRDAPKIPDTDPFFFPPKNVEGGGK
jgi:Spy/CpxP family protein refolding chaperone